MTNAQAMNNPLDWITVKGFRSIAHVEKLELTPVNVLIGANGSGKSNFVDVFPLLRCWAEGRLDGYVGRSGERTATFTSAPRPRRNCTCSLPLPTANAVTFIWPLRKMIDCA